MEDLEFTIRFVTPAFIGGGDDKEADTSLQYKGRKPRHRQIGPGGDSLRIPSLRGVLRFWLRAKEDPRDLDVLKKKEASVFGSADTGQGLRLRPIGRPAWTKEIITSPAGDAKAYLGYGPMNYNDETRQFSTHNKFTFRDAIPAGTAFSFAASGTKQQIKELRNCLTLLHLFGGIGARSRRGWGSVKIESEGIASVAMPEKPEGLREWFEELLDDVWQESHRPSHIAAPPPYSAFSEKTGIRLTPVLEGDYLPVFDQLYRQFAEVRLWDYRSRGRGSWKRSVMAQDDHDLEGKDAKDPKALTDVPQRLAYGLPYSPKSRNSGWEISYHGRLANASKTDEREWTTRRASPLFLKVHQFAPNRHFGVALHLDAQFFGDSNLEIGAEGKPKTLPTPGPAAIHDFLNNPGWTQIVLP